MKHLSRRALLRGAGAAAVGLPLLDFMGDPAKAQGVSPPKRLIFFGVPVGFGGRLPDGTDPFWPTGTETNFNLGDVLSPLAAHQNELLVIKNVAMKLGVGSGSHGEAVGQTMCGELGVPKAFPPRPEAGISIDQYIAARLPQTKFRTLYFRASSRDTFCPLSYESPNAPAFPTVSPQKAFDDVFRDFAVGTGSATAAADKERTRQQSVVDSVKADFARLSSKLGASDRAKLDAHLTAVHDIESRLAAATPTGVGCVKPTLTLPAGAPPAPVNGDWKTNNAYWNTDDHVPQASDLHIAVLTAALACDLTRVATFEHHHFGDDEGYPWLGVSDLHNLSHDGSESSVRKSITVYNWYAGQLAKLITSLKAIREGNGTLFDSTAIVWIQELSAGNHQRENQPLLIAGRCGGYFRSGRYVTTYPGFGTGSPVCCGDGTNAPGQHLMNDLHLTLIAAMGLPAPSGGTFGRPEWCQSGLPGLS